MKHVNKIPLNNYDLDTLNFLLAQVTSKRHFQQKVGSSFYARLIKDGKESRLAVVPGWAIIDLTHNRQYIFRNTVYADIYNRLVNKLYR